MRVTQKNQIDGAIWAQCLQGMMGHPSQHDFKNLVCDQMIQNCPITYHDVTNAYKIFRPDLAALRGKTLQKDPTRMQPENVEIPREVIEQNKMAKLTADIMFVNGIPFIVTYGRGIGLITVEWIPNRMKKQLELNITKVLQLYS